MNEPAIQITSPGDLSPSYTYAPLNTEIREIRVVDLHPGEFSDEIICDIRHVSLDNDPVYQALSYTWGSLNDSATIQLNGFTFSITRNLESAIRHLRPRSKKARNPPLWIDSICINQADIAERNAQVQYMANIYKKAPSVCAWLGEEEDDSSLAMEFLSTAEKLVFTGKTSPGEDRGKRAELWVCEVLHDPQCGKTIDALKKLSKREYWSRLWICQELASSERMTIFRCGNHVISRIAWLVLIQATHDALQNPRRPSNFYEWLLPTIYPWVMEYQRRGTVSSIFDFSAPEVVEYHRDLLSTDPRDKIYGLVGLIDAFRETAYTIDYGLSVEEVYRHFCELIVSEYGSLNIICATDVQDAEHGLPSWCPDWSTNQSGDVDPRLGLGLGAAIYHASGDSKPMSQFISIEDNHFLIAQGWCIDRIQRLSGPFLSCRRPVTFGGSVADWAQVLDFFEILETDPSASKADEKEATLSAEPTSDLMSTSTDNSCWETIKVSYEMVWRTLLTNALPLKDSSKKHYIDAYRFWQMYVTIRIRAGSSTSQIYGSDGSHALPSCLEPFSTATASEAVFEVTDELVNNTSDEEFEEFTRPFHGWVRLRLRSRQLMQSTRYGFPGLAPMRADVGDLVCVFMGCDHPVVLRKSKVDDSFLFIGQAHIPQLANGEVLEMEKEGKVELEPFPIR